MSVRRFEDLDIIDLPDQFELNRRQRDSDDQWWREEQEAWRKRELTANDYCTPSSTRETLVLYRQLGYFTVDGIRYNMHERGSGHNADRQYLRTMLQFIDDGNGNCSNFRMHFRDYDTATGKAKPGVTRAVDCDDEIWGDLKWDPDIRF